MNVVNNALSPVTITLKNADPNFDLRPLSPLRRTIQPHERDDYNGEVFTNKYATPIMLTRAQSQGAVILTATNVDSKEPVLINGKRFFALDLSLQEIPAESVLIVISSKGLQYFLRKTIFSK